jgi:hypothetical protein
MRRAGVALPNGLLALAALRPELLEGAVKQWQVPAWDARSTSQVKLANLADPAMARFLIVLGLAILVVGLLWPYLSRIGLGRLPGDIVIERDNVTLYFPLMTCFLLSLLFSLVLWAVNRWNGAG